MKDELSACVEFWKLRFICDLGFEIWCLYDVNLERMYYYFNPYFITSNLDMTL